MLRACSVRLGPSLPKHLNKHNKRRMKACWLPSSMWFVHADPCLVQIAIEGCCHGALDAIYAHIASLEQKNNYKVSLLLIGGDFQAIRNERDLQCMAVPDKYRKLGGFWKWVCRPCCGSIRTTAARRCDEAHGWWVGIIRGKKLRRF